MPVVAIITPPATREEYDAVTREIGPDKDPPAGLILHAAGEVDGKLHIVEVWESHEAAERFNEERRRPAIEKLAGNPGNEAVPPTVFEAHNVFRGSGEV